MTDKGTVISKNLALQEKSKCGICPRVFLDSVLVLGAT
jgi:hypothetical protein